MRRVRPHGAAGRTSLPGAAYLRLKWMILDRAGWRCERCRHRVQLQVDHAVPRSHGGPDTWANLSALCAGANGCHAMKDRPYQDGRLAVTPLGEGRFRYAVIHGTRGTQMIGDIKWGGRAPTEEEASQLAEIMAEARQLTAR